MLTKKEKEHIVEILNIYIANKLIFDKNEESMKLSNSIIKKLK